jgi:hypothetical protein
LRNHHSLLYMRVVDEPPAEGDRQVRTPVVLPPPATAVEPPVRLLPIIHLKPDGPMEVPVVFERSSGTIIRYLADAEGNVRHLKFVLKNNGEVIDPLDAPPEPAEDEQRIEELGRNQRLVRHISLRERYGNLEPGVYLLEAHMEGQPTGLGLTQIFLHRPLMYVQIGEVNEE